MRAYRRLVVAALLSFAAASRAGVTGPPGSAVGDKETPFEGLAISADAQDSTGAAQTRVGIDVPPGRNGLQPELGFVYSSQAPAGIYGAGWDVPIGYVARSTRRGVPAFDASDLFALVLPGVASELTPVAGGYALRIDEIHASITVDGGSNTWTMHEASGRTLTFGGETPARVGPDPASFTPARSAFDATYAWHLTRIADAAGNTIDFHYRSFGDGYAYPDHVDYGGNGGFAHPFSVTFGWEARAASAQRASYGGGFRQAATQRLTEVVTKLSGVAVKRYVPSWADSQTNQGPLLTDVVQVGANGTPLPRADGTNAATSFGYHPVPAPIFPASAPTENLHVKSFRDGGNCANRDFIDLNGDGLPDLVLTSGWSSKNKAWKVYLHLPRNDPSGKQFATDAVDWPAPAECLTKRGTDPNTYKVYGILANDSYALATLADMDGDGLVDYVSAIPSPSPWYVYRNLGNGFDPNGEPWVANDNTWRYGALELLYHGASFWYQFWRFEDVNGDGRADVISAADTFSDPPGPWKVLWNIWDPAAGRYRFADSFVPISKPPTGDLAFGASGINVPDVTTDFFDINGDGLPDAVQARHHEQIHVFYGDGRGHWDGGPGGDGYVWPIDVPSDPNIYPLRLFEPSSGALQADLFDVNGDELPDYVYHLRGEPGTTYHVCRNTGASFAPAQVWTLPTTPRQKSSDGTALRVDMFDLNGDGYPDIVELPSGSTTAKIWIGNPPGGLVPADALVSVTNPLGGITTLAYDVSTSFDTGAIDPDLSPVAASLPFPVWVVNEIDKYPGPGQPGAERRALQYDGGYFDATRREFRGFANTYSTDLDHTITQATTYHQTDALRGRPKGIWRFARGNIAVGLFSSTFFTWGTTGTNDHHVVTLDAREEAAHSSATGDTVFTSGPRQRAKTVYAHDACGGVTAETTCDFGADTTASACTSASASAIKTTTASFATEPHYRCSADGVCTSGFCDHPASVTVADATSPVAMTYTYNAGGSVLTESRNGFVTRSSYGALGNLDTRTDPGNHVTRISDYDATKIHPRTVVQDDGGVGLTTVTETDARWGKPTSVIDPSGATTTYAYDEFGRDWQVAEPGQALDTNPTRWFGYVIGVGESRVETHSWEPNRGACTTGPGGADKCLDEVAFTDGLGRPLQQQAVHEVAGVERIVVTGAKSYPAGGWVDLEYAPFVGSGDVKARIAMAAKPATQIYYDQLGREILRIHPDGRHFYTSSAIARVARSCDALVFIDPSHGQCIEEESDALARLVERRVYKGAASGASWFKKERRTYDGAGRVVAVTQNDNALTAVTTAYNGLGLKASERHPDGGMWTYRYDNDGNLTYLDDPVLNQHVETTYDGLHRTVDRFVYDRDALGAGTRTQVAHYTYDDSTVPFGRGRIATTSYASPGFGSGFKQVTAYDPRGQIRSELERIVVLGDDREFTTTNDYDPIGRPLTVSYPHPAGTDLLRYAYTPLGSIANVGSDHGGYVAAIGHDVLGRVATIAFANDVSDTFTYAGASKAFRLQRIQTGKAGVAVPYRQVGYEDYDLRGNVRAIRDTLHVPSSRLAATTTSAYDDHSHLVHAIQCGGPANYDASFAVDALDNLTAKDGQTHYFEVPSRPHQVTRIDLESITHDANGSVRTTTGGRTLYFDQQNQLGMVTKGSSTFTYLYDEVGRRVASKTPDGVTYFFKNFDVRGGQVVRHVWADGALVASSPVSAFGTLAAADVPERVLVARNAFVGLAGVFLSLGVAVGGRGRRAFMAIAMVVMMLMTTAETCRTVAPPPPGTLFYHVDHLGTPQLLTDAGGAIAEHLFVRPYGALGGLADGLGRAKATALSTFFFAGQRGDDGSGLLYFNARYYDPGVGAFVSHDPAAQFFSPYSYAGGNPLSMSDPDGTYCLFCDVGDAGYGPGDNSIGFEQPDYGTALAAQFDPIYQDQAFGGAQTISILQNPFVAAALAAPIVDAASVMVGGAIGYFAGRGGADVVEEGLTSGVGGALSKRVASSEENMAFTFRGDPRPPEVVFGQGIPAKGTSTDLLAHALDSSNPPSAFVSTSASEEVAARFAENVYVVRPVRGIDVNEALGRLSPFPGESEIAIPSRISPSDIRAVTLLRQRLSLLNPNWAP